MSAREDLIDQYGRATEAPLGTLAEFRQKLDAYREEVRREILGDDLNPSSPVLDAQAYRRLRETITATMDDPDRWDRDGDEGSTLSDYVQWLADGKPARDDGRENETEPTHLGPDPAHGGLTTLTDTERVMLRYAIGCAREDMDDRADEFTADDEAALESLRNLANGPVVAYRNPYRPGVLLCREHGDGWAGLAALHAHDLPDGGTCTFGDPADPDDVCGRDVLAEEA